MQITKEADIWRRILETGDVKELNILLKMVIKDEESINVIMDKFTNSNETSNNLLKITINVDKVD